MNATRLAPDIDVSRLTHRSDLGPLFASLGYTRGAEIGVWKGVYAQQLCESIPGLQLLCVDPYLAYDAYREQKNDQRRLDEAWAEAQARLAPYACTFLKMPSADAAITVKDRSLDFVYLDGNHLKPYVLQDLDLWTAKVRSGGIVAGHDYRLQQPKPFIQVKEAVDQFTAARQIRPVYLLTGDKSPSFFWLQP